MKEDSSNWILEESVDNNREMRILTPMGTPTAKAISMFDRRGDTLDSCNWWGGGESSYK